MKPHCSNLLQENHFTAEKSFTHMKKWSNVPYSTDSQAYSPKTSCNWHEVMLWNTDISLEGIVKCIFYKQSEGVSSWVQLSAKVKHLETIKNYNNCSDIL